MDAIVLKNSFLLLIIGLTTCFGCTNPSKSSNIDHQTAKDSFAILVNQKPEAVNDLSTAISNFVGHEALRHASVSISVIDHATGQEMASYQPQLSIIPASSLKVISTATGLAMLGKEYRFNTEITHDGTLTDGVLDGNLYIKGYGDPTLGFNKLNPDNGLAQLMTSWAMTIRKKGIRQINGYVVGDASWLPTAVNSPTWQWNDLGNYYASGAWGLNVHENLYYLHFQKNARLGGKPKITGTNPSIPTIDWTNELTSGAKGSGDNAYIYGAPYSNRRFVRGTIPMGTGTFKIKGAIPNPPLLAAQELTKALLADGIKVGKGATTNMEIPSPSDTKFVWKKNSTYLFDIAKECNLKSVNLYAEAILRAIAKQNGKAGSIADGLQVVMDYWASKGWDTKGLFMEDASGLSPRNAVSARHLSQFMYLVSQETDLYPTFKNTLAVGGKTGTLQLMFKGTAAEGNIWGKSGSMTRARSYTGYAKTRAGKMVSFSIIANNYTGSNSEMRKLMERLMVALCN